MRQGVLALIIVAISLTSAGLMVLFILWVVGVLRGRGA